MDAALMRKAMEYAKDLDLTVITHSEDSCLKGCGVMNEGLLSTQMGLKGIPKISEDIIVGRDVMLAKKLGTRLHVAHVSSKGSLEIIQRAKQENVFVTAEATPHHLHLTEQAVEGYNTLAKVAPPLRTENDKNSLIAGLKNKVIEVLASDHAPHSYDEKECEFDKAEFGMVGLETAFSLYYELVLRKQLNLKDLVQAMTFFPAKIIGVNKGTLKVGADADITLFDPTKNYTIDSKRFYSKSLNTPFHGRQVQGKVMMTIVSGNIVYDFRGSL
jgi:dihydroorotase